MPVILPATSDRNFTPSSIGDPALRYIVGYDVLGQMLGESLSGHTCKGMKGLIAEGEEVMKEFTDSDVLDAALIAAAQRVEHYEIAGYGCARTYAHMLGFAEQADLLQRTLDEEGDTDHRLTDLAETVINIDAMR